MVLSHFFLNGGDVLRLVQSYAQSALYQNVFALGFMPIIFQSNTIIWQLARGFDYPVDSFNMPTSDKAYGEMSGYEPSKDYAA